MTSGTYQAGGQRQAPSNDAQSRELTVSVARTVATQIADRVQTDPAFVAELVANPRQTLEANGVPPEAVNDLIGPAGRLPLGRADAEQPRCFLSIGCISTPCCFSISVCCFSGSC